MKTIIMYYSLKGSSKKEAEKTANQNMGAVLCEVTEKRKRNMFSAFIPGCPQSMNRKKSEINSIPYQMENYDKIILIAPIWGGFPAPAFNAMVELLPNGKDVEVVLCSAGGETPKSMEGTKQIIRDKGCNLIEYRDVKTAQ